LFTLRPNGLPTSLLLNNLRLRQSLTSTSNQLFTFCPNNFLPRQIFKLLFNFCPNSLLSIRIIYFTWPNCLFFVPITYLCPNRLLFVPIVYFMSQSCTFGFSCLFSIFLPVVFLVNKKTADHKIA